MAARVPVAAICGAAAGLARAGLLDDRRHTSNAREYLQATGYAGEVLDMWRGLFKSGDPAYYAALVKATQG